MKIGLCLAALALLVPVIGVSAQEKTPAVLKNPAALKEKAPAKYRAQFETTQGTFVVDVTRAWSPNGADRFYNLVKNGFFDHVKFFRVVPGFVVQFGIHGDPAIATKWLEANIQDDSKVIQGNKRGFLTFAKSGAPNSRSTQLFINLKDNDRLDDMGFSPLGRVVEGMEVVEQINSEYGESPEQGRIQTEGNEYLKQNFPNLDYIKTARVE